MLYSEQNLTAPKSPPRSWAKWFRARGKVSGQPRIKFRFGEIASGTRPRSHMAVNQGHPVLFRQFEPIRGQIQRKNYVSLVNILGNLRDTPGYQLVFGSGRWRSPPNPVPYLGAGLRFSRTPVKPSFRTMHASPTWRHESWMAGLSGIELVLQGCKVEPVIAGVAASRGAMSCML